MAGTLYMNFIWKAYKNLQFCVKLNLLIPIFLRKTVYCDLNILLNLLNAIIYV